MVTKRNKRRARRAGQPRGTDFDKMFDALLDRTVRATKKVRKNRAAAKREFDAIFADVDGLLKKGAV